MGILNTIMKGILGDGDQSEGVGGITGWMKDNSKALSQYLAAAGMDAAEGGGLGKNFNNVTMQRNSSDSMTQLLTQLLGGGMPGVEAKIDEKGLSINMSRETPVGQPGPDPGTTGIAPLVNMSAPINSAQPQGGVPAPAPADAPATPAQAPAQPAPVQTSSTQPEGRLRPFFSDLSGVSASDLVGLSPELILQALQLDQGQEQINDQKYRDYINAQYNMGMLSDAQKRTALSEQRLPIEQMDANSRYLNALSDWAKMDRDAPMEVPGLDKLSLDEWDKLPVDTKAYAYYAFDAKRRGEEVMDFNTWKNQPNSPQIYEIYKMSQSDPEFAKFALKWQKSGATSVNINNKVEEDLERGYIQSRLLMYDPTARESAINAELKKLGISEKMMLKMEGDSPEALKLRSDYVDRAVKRIVSAGNGRVVKSAVSPDGSSIGWVVEWTERDGTKKEEFFRHALK